MKAFTCIACNRGRLDCNLLFFFNLSFVPLHKMKPDQETIFFLNFLSLNVNNYSVTCGRS